MNNEHEKTLEQVLRETPWSAILVPLAIALLVSMLIMADVVIRD